MPHPAAPDPSRPYNLAAALLEPHLAAGRAGVTAVRHAGRDLSYGELAEQVARTGNALRALGVRAEERVVVLLPDTPAFVATFLGALQIGAVPVPVNPAIGAEALAYQLVDSRARTVVTAGGAVADLAAVLDGHGTAVRAVALAGDTAAGGLPELQADLPVDTVAELADLVAAAAPDPRVEGTGPDDIAFWLYSSGTTGRPKAVVHVHGAPWHSYEGLARGVLGVDADDRTYSVSKLFSPSGLGNSLFFPFFAGASTVLVPEPPSAEVVAATIAAEQPTLLFGRPVNYRAILDGVPAEAMRSVRLAVCSGDRLDADLRQRFLDRYRVEIVEGTGSTEALHIYLCNRPGRLRPGSSGELVPGYDARLVAEDGAPVPDGEIGDLHLRGGSTFLCYWRNRAKTRETLLGDWVVTGDKYRRDADGFYWYAGRSDDMWFEDGRWVSPTEIEDALAAHPGVGEAAATRTTAPDGTADVLACVVVADRSAFGDDPGEELAALVADRLGPGRRPREVRVVDALPRTASGKVQRHRLPELAAVGG